MKNLRKTLLKIFAVVFCLLILPQLVFSQTSGNFKAQGYYYKAKELYESKNYSAALPYLEKTKVALAGTNEQTQYLYIMCYVAIKDWVNANKELAVYVDLIENRQKIMSFTKTVESLTDDETKALSKAMVDIEENAAFTESPEGIKKKNSDEFFSTLNYLVYDNYSGTEGTSKASEKLVKLGGNSYKYKRTGSWKEKRPDCSDKVSAEEEISFSIEEISSAKYVAEGWFWKFHCASLVECQSGGVLQLTLKNVKSYKSEASGYYECRGSGGGDFSKSCDYDTYTINIRIRNNDQEKINKLNELLKGF
jgi:hypothetical protein